MVGNDVVDLTEANRTSNWQRPRFLDKLFTETEKQAIEDSENVFETVWRLWSKKEAAYKLYTQFNPSRFYSPKKFECFTENKVQKVRFNNFECFVSSETTSKYIVSEAHSTPFRINPKVLEFSDKNIKAQSEKLRRALLTAISKTYHISASELKFQKIDFGIPMVSFKSEQINVSLSHHGNFGAFAFTKAVIPVKT